MLAELGDLSRFAHPRQGMKRREEFDQLVAAHLFAKHGLAFCVLFPAAVLGARAPKHILPMQMKAVFGFLWYRSRRFMPDPSVI